jgi:hypothetical protein
VNKPIGNLNFGCFEMWTPWNAAHAIDHQQGDRFQSAGANQLALN